MADYWKSIDKKYCDVCKCWLTDNKASVQFHENGNRHKLNIQKRLKDIHVKNKAEASSGKKLEHDMRKIEQAAAAAAKKDMEDNPDVSMKIQSYYNLLKEDECGKSTGSTETEEKKSNKPTVLHRSEKKKKADQAVLANMFKPTKDYEKLSGWESAIKKTGGNYLELPSKSTKSPGTALQLAARVEQEREPIKFAEKRAPSATASSSGVKVEQSEVTFKKRKLAKTNMRQRGDDN